MSEVTKQAEVDVAEVITEVAALLRAGASTQQAWVQVLGQQPANTPWGTAGQEIAAGQPVAQTLRRYAAQLRVPGPLLAAAAGCELAVELGSSAADVLDQCVDTVAELQAAANERQAALAGPKATMRVLKALPIIALFLFQGAGVNALEALLTTAVGWSCAVSGAGLLIAGSRWVRKLVARAEDGGAT